VVATTLDGRIRLINTPTARLARAASLYRRQIATMMFEV
jgi:vacuolar-type H+-ATPase subunit E/Vma4